MSGLDVLKALIDGAVICTLGFVAVESVQNWRLK
jgi:isopentenyl diphosphate isomerase/L-lactate dehydrogenase-like FMN-dependent dehydrogenase